MQELVAYAKANPKSLNFGSSGNGTSMHLAGEQFKFATSIDIVHVPFKESAHALTALLGDHIQLTFHQLAAVIEQIKAGTVKALAVTSKQRVAALPNVPTVAESGFPGFESVTLVRTLCARQDAQADLGQGQSGGNDFTERRTRKETAGVRGSSAPINIGRAFGCHHQGHRQLEDRDRSSRR